MNKTPFTVGENVVYPKHGVSVIEGLEERVNAGKKYVFYCVRLSNGDTRVLVPQTQTKEVGLRRLIPKKEIRKFFDYLRSTHIEFIGNWKERYEVNHSRIESGSIYDSAYVLKSLALVNTVKSLSFREREMYEHTKQFVASEIAAVSGDDIADIERKLDKALAEYAVVDGHLTQASGKGKKGKSLAK